MMRLMINVGFITNSSSVIHFFPKGVLAHPDFQAFMDAYGLKGFVAEDLWGHPASVAVTQEQRQAMVDQMMAQRTHYNVKPEDWKYRIRRDPSRDEVWLAFRDDDYGGLVTVIKHLIEDLGFKPDGSIHFN